MKIAHLTDSFYPNVNGVTTSVMNNSKSMAARGHEIMIFAAKPNTKKFKNFREINLGKNVTIERFPSLKLKKWDVSYQLTLPSTGKIFREMREFDPDVLHVHTPTIIGWQAIIYSKLFDVPLITTYHALIEGFTNHLPISLNNNSQLVEKAAHSYCKMFHNRCDLVISPSRFIKKHIIKHGVKCPIEVVSNGVDTGLFFPRQANKAKDGKSIIHIGRISNEKNIDVLLKAFALASKRVDGLKLTIVGPGPDLGKFKKLAKSLKLKNVEFTGRIDHKKLPKIYSNADLFATASTIETEGLVVLEAMACGLPVVGVDAMALHDIIKHNNTGLISAPGDEKAMADNMVRLVSDSKLRNAFSRNSMNHVKAYALGNSINKLENIYKRLSNNGKRPKY